MELLMTKCLSCGHFRHDLELNCPQCGSFYSVIMSELMLPDKSQIASGKLVQKLQTHLTHSKIRKLVIVIFAIILLGIFL